jgi:hypothetical protein
MKTYWLSFAPEEGRARVMVVDATGKRQAYERAVRLGMSREGDEVLIIEIPPEEEEHRLPRDRELTEADLRGVGAVLLGDEIDRERANTEQEPR